MTVWPWYDSPMPLMYDPMWPSSNMWPSFRRMLTYSIATPLQPGLALIPQPVPVGKGHIMTAVLLGAFTAAHHVVIALEDAVSLGWQPAELEHPVREVSDDGVSCIRRKQVSAGAHNLCRL